MFKFKKREGKLDIDELYRNLVKLDQLSKELDDLNNAMLLSLKETEEEVNKIMGRIAV